MSNSSSEGSSISSKSLLLGLRIGSKLEPKSGGEAAFLTAIESRQKVIYDISSFWIIYNHNWSAEIGVFQCKQCVCE
jgi:hypothetical protein